MTCAEIRSWMLKHRQAPLTSSLSREELLLIYMAKGVDKRSYRSICVSLFFLAHHPNTLSLLCPHASVLRKEPSQLWGDSDKDLSKMTEAPRDTFISIMGKNLKPGKKTYIWHFLSSLSVWQKHSQSAATNRKSAPVPHLPPVFPSLALNCFVKKLPGF